MSSSPLHDALLSYGPLSPVLNSPGSALARWLQFAKHSCLACECETTTAQLQKNVFFGLSPLAVPLWQEGRDRKVEERRGEREGTCRLLRQEGKDEITPAALPLLTASLCAIPQHLRWLHHSATLGCEQRRRKAFVVSFPVFFISKSSPEGAAGPAHSPTATRLPDRGGLLRKYHAWAKQLHQNTLLNLLSPSHRFLGGFVSMVSPSLFPQCCKWVTLAGTCDL